MIITILFICTLNLALTLYILLKPEEIKTIYKTQYKETQKEELPKKRIFINTDDKAASREPSDQQEPFID